MPERKETIVTKVLVVRVELDDSSSVETILSRLTEALESRYQFQTQVLENMMLVPDFYQVGNLHIDTKERHVTLGGQTLHLTNVEYRILLTLVGNLGDTLTREQFSQKVWGRDGIERAIDVHIRRLRVKLDSGPVPPPIIHSIWGIGYRIEDPSQAARAG